MFLRQSTSQAIRFGPFLDDTDFKTAETALTIAQADMQLSKDGAAFAQKNAAGNATHDTDGWYSTTLDATDTGTVGELIMQVVVAGALPVWVRYWVVEEAVYDNVYGAAAVGPAVAGDAMDLVANAVDATAIATGAIDADALAADAITAAKIANGAIDAATFAAGAIDATAIGTGAIDADAIATDAITAAKIAANAIGSSELADGAITAAKFGAGAIDAAAIATNAIDADALATDAVNEVRDAVLNVVTGTADAGSTASTIVDAERTEAVTDYWKHGVVEMTSGANVGQLRRVTAFNITTDTLTVAPAFKSAVAAGDTYRIVRVLADGLRPITEGNEATDVAADGDVGADVQTWLDAAVNALVSGRVDASVGAMAAAVLTAAAIATDAIDNTKIAAGAITSSEAPNLDAAVTTRATPAQVNTEVADVLKVDTVTLPGQIAPTATPTMETIFAFLYKAFRNRKTQTASQWNLYDDAGTTIDQKAPVSDDGTTAEKSEIVTGP